MSRRIRPLTAVLTLVLALPGLAAADDASTATFRAPADAGLIALGETVAYDLDVDGADCSEVEVRAVVAGGLAGESSPGCQGTVRVPDEAELAEAETDPSAVHEVTLVAEVAGTSVAEAGLLNKRYHLRHAEVLFGDVEIGPGEDPLSPGEVITVSGSGATLSLGTVDLSETSSLSFRLATLEDAGAWCVWEFYCSSGRGIITAGSPNGPVISTIDLRTTGGAEEWGRYVDEPARVSFGGPVEVFVTFFEQTPAQCGPVSTPKTPVGYCGGDAPWLRVNYIEFNGSGVAEPHDDGDESGWTTLFDGTSLDGWEVAGDGWFTVEDDGSLRAQGRAGLGAIWYAAQEFDDHVLRLEYRVDRVESNSGVYVRATREAMAANDWEDSYGSYEFQIDDFGQTYYGSGERSQTGAVYDLSAPERVNTRTVGEWNTYEIRAEGQGFTVTLNGREVNRYTGERGLSGHVAMQSHDPASVVWFRNIRVLPLDGTNP